MMICNKTIQPEFTAEQIAECQTCKHISGKKAWCCLFGCWVKEGQGRIIQPNKKLLTPSRKLAMPRKPPTLAEMAVHFAKAMAKWTKSGFRMVDKETYIKRRMACSVCQPTGRCPHCGCNLWAKAALATEKCIEDKW